MILNLFKKHALLFSVYRMFAVVHKVSLILDKFEIEIYFCCRRPCPNVYKNLFADIFMLEEQVNELKSY